MYFANIFVLAALLAAVVPFGNCDSDNRLFGGQDVDTLKQFPHHVTIIPDKSEKKCGGSILTAQWILTSSLCISGYPRLYLHFNKQFDNDASANYYGISINSDNIYVYPTNFDDLALIKIPTQLVFSDTIQPIGISNQSISSLETKFAVLPGFNELSDVNVDRSSGSNNLKYGMFKVLASSSCKTFYGSEFNEYNELCVGNWDTTADVPCESDVGNGLVIGWPGMSELVGIYSSNSQRCASKYPTRFTYVAKYMPWIQRMIYN